MRDESFHYPLDRKKWSTREQLLLSSPELAISVDTLALKKIIPYKRFLCHPYSSVALGHAKRGSDIDGGLVILEKSFGTKTQFSFVKELRHQGFDVYHTDDFFTARARLDEYKSRAALRFNLPYDSLSWDQIALLGIGQDVANRSDEVNNIYFKVIRFHTEKELNQLSRTPGYPDYFKCQDRELEIFVSGFDIN